MSEKTRSITSSNNYHRICSLEVRGGFLDDMRLEFDGGLNCIIGGRGTGKTTAIELIRYVLGEMPDSKKFSDLSGQLDKLISGNLGTGKISLSIHKPRMACSIPLIAPTMPSLPIITNTLCTLSP